MVCRVISLPVSTASSFRAAIPPGDVTVEDYLTAVPYKNLVLVHELTGAQVQQLLDLSAGRKGTDGFSQVSGVRFTIQDGKAIDYRVAATDFQAKIAPGYSDLFKQAASVTDTGIIVNDLMMSTLKTSSPASAALDGRVRSSSEI